MATRVPADRDSGTRASVASGDVVRVKLCRANAGRTVHVGVKCEAGMTLRTMGKGEHVEGVKTCGRVEGVEGGADEKGRNIHELSNC